MVLRARKGHDFPSEGMEGGSRREEIDVGSAHNTAR